MNFFRGRIERAAGSDGLLEFVETNTQASPLRLRLDSRLSANAAGKIGQEIIFGIRPEDVQDGATLPQFDLAPGAEVKVEVSEPMGAETFLYLHTGATSFVARVRPTDRFETGQRVKVAFRLEAAHLFDAATEQVLK